MERSKYEVAQAWAEIVIDRWKQRMAALDIGDSGALLRSFEAQVTADARGDPAKITFTFLYYGRFPDMGVGRGVKLPDVPDPHRKVKHWYSPVFITEVMKLGRMMAEKYGYEAVDTIAAFSSSMYAFQTSGIKK